MVQDERRLANSGGEDASRAEVGGVWGERDLDSVLHDLRCGAIVSQSVHQSVGQSQKMEADNTRPLHSPFAACNRKSLW